MGIRLNPFGTHRRRETRTQQTSERDRSLLQSVLDAVSEGVIVANERGEFLLFNPAAERIIGIGPIDTSRGGWSARYGVYRTDGVTPIPSSELPMVRAVLGEAIDDMEMILRNEGLDGDAYISASARPLHSDAGVRGGVVVVRDITQRKLSEEALRASEELHSLLVRQAPIGIVTTDAAGHVTKANPAALQILGSPSEEATRQFNVLSMPALQEAGVSERFARVLRDKQPETMETTYTSYWGKTSDIRFMIVPLLGEQGSVLGTLTMIEDVSERRRAEDALRRSEERHRQLVESTFDLITETDTRARFVYASPRYLDVLGYHHDELIGTRALDLVHPDDAERVQRELLSEARRSSYRARHKNGEWRWFESVARLTVVDGQLRAVSATRDITDRKRAEEALLASEELLRATLESTADGILVVSSEGATVYFNPRFAEMWQIPQAVLDSRSDEQMLRYVLDQLCDPEAFIAKVRELYASEAESFDTLDFKDDRVFERYSRPLMGPEGMAGRVWSFRDVTLRVHAEQAVREANEFRERVMESATNAIAALDRDGRFTLVNRRLAEMTGYSVDQLLGQHFGILFADDDPEARGNYRRVISGGESLEGVETTLVRNDGSPCVISYSLGPLMEDGNIVGAAVTAEDISERKRLEAQFLQSQRLESVGRLAGGVAHDFNNLMTAVIGYSELAIMSMPPGDALRVDLQEIRETAERAAGLAHQLLAFSRRQIIEPKVLNLNELIVGTERMLRRLIGEDIELAFLPGSALGQVRVDPGQFEQVLVNLVVNARDAMPDGGKLTLETANVEPDDDFAQGHTATGPGRFVMLAVADSGVGMTQEVQRHLFEPFFTTKEQGKGTGLGLATCYGIVKQAGGNIVVHSEPGCGSTFKIYLPRAEGAMEALPRRDEAGFLPGGKETILLVEDEQSVRSLAARVLRELGYHVLEAANGSDALRVAGEHEGDVHLVLTDVVMPQMGGKELADRLRRERPLTKVLFTSGYTDDAIVRHGVLEHAISFLQKPFSPGGLARKVREALDREAKG